MFTGIVQAQGTLTTLTPTPAGVRLTVDRAAWSPPAGYAPAPGNSICVSGVCLTVIDPTPTTLSFDVITETLDRTTLGQKNVGDAVNLEPAVMPSQPLGGHFMQGHIDGTGTVHAIADDPADWRLTLAVPADLMPYMVPKGSAALDGVSLTLAEVDPDANTITVALIPTTLDLTTLGRAKIGDPINLEADVLIKAVVQNLQRVLATNTPADPVTMQLLDDAGFTTP